MVKTCQPDQPGEGEGISCAVRSPGVVHAFVLIEAELAHVADLAEALAEVDGVAEVYSVASDDADLVAIIRVRRHEDLAEVVTRRIAALEGIVRHQHHGGLQVLQPSRPRSHVGCRSGLRTPQPSRPLIDRPRP